MKDILVGSTGFVGQNLRQSHTFELAVHSTDIEKAYDTHPELLVYAGVPAEMFLANTAPDQDFARMEQAAANIRKIAPKTLVLISTVAVHPKTKSDTPTGWITEETQIEDDQLPAYGKNRLWLERFALKEVQAGAIERVLIIRLPALYGVGLKKNFLYDFIHLIPSMLKEDKYRKLVTERPDLAQAYQLSDNGFYKLASKIGKLQADMLHRSAQNEVNQEASLLLELKAYYAQSDFNALSFTDSRSRYQFYNLKNLWNDIQKGLEQTNITILGLMTEPISVSELYAYLTGKEFINELPKPPFDYDVRTMYSHLWGREDGYIAGRAQVLNDIQSYIENY